MADVRDQDATRTVESGSEDAAPVAHAGAWGDLRLLSELGHGAFGRVYRAWDESLAREVALKVVKPRDASQRASVLIEGQMLARVKHNHVVTVHRAQQIDDEVGLTMELIKGRPLAHIVEQTGPMGAEEASVIGISLCQALAAVHGAGLLHRDIKAHNVMRESGGRIVLMDFGAGRHVKESKVSDLSGTPLYLAPELFTGHAASPASDLYSLGVLLFYLVTGKHPVEGRTLTEIMLVHTKGNRTQLSDLRPDLPGRFVQVVDRALASAPDQRFRTAGEMQHELSDAMPGASRSRHGAVSISSRENVPVIGSDGLARQDRADLPTVRRIPLAVRGLLALAGGFAIMLVLGYLTTKHYDRAIGRTPEFSEDGFTDWLKYGFGLLLPMAVWMTLLMVILRLMGALWHFVQRLAPPVRRLANHARTSISGTFGRVAGWDGASIAQALLIAQTVAVAVVLWRYRELIVLLPKTVNDVDPASLALLAPVESNGTLYSYAPVMSTLLAMSLIAWVWLRRQPLLWVTVPTASVVAASALSTLVVLLIAIPDRLFFKSEAQAVTYAGTRCFVTGSRGDERLLYCPDQVIRTPIVTSAEVSGPGSVPGRIFGLPPAPETDKK